MTYATGALVRARGREWVVLPESDDEFLVLRPLGGADDEIAGIYLPVERVDPATFDLPDPEKPGDHTSCQMLRDAVRLGFRSSAGPFRSFGRLGVEPRPYQLVPLLMALKLDPVRLLIADDVGIGKTVEAALVARELLDRGEIQRMAVLCPPHLADQWRTELRDKFHIDARLVLPSTARGLERHCRAGESLFDRFPFVIVSTDFIKSDRRRDDFLRASPKFVIVDEAHTCATGALARGTRHQRHQLLKGLASDPSRHLILVTATPHSGNEDAFRSLLTLLDPELANLPPDLTGARNESHRRRLAAHLVQRRRGDIRRYMDADTPFPDRTEREETWELSPEYRALFDRVLAYARETVADDLGGRHHQRIRWWSAIALLRSLASSPAAAAATLRSRAASAGTETDDEADEIGRRTVLDLSDDDAVEAMDVVPGSDPDADSGDTSARRRLQAFARDAEALEGAADRKLQNAVEMVKGLVDDGFNPIVFCRFIPTADYVAKTLRAKLRGVEVVSVTGEAPPDDREARVAELGKATHRVLVCTDCLSEGINLQDHFDAVVHYDLSWNPTRHEQREGRVDRYGQASSEVRMLTYYGIDNRIDGIVLDVLLRKHKKIRSSLGIAVPVPGDSNSVVEAIFEGLLLRGGAGGKAEQMAFDGFFEPKRRELHAEWEAAVDREKRSRTMFAQDAIKVDDVARELDAVRAAIGSGVDVRRFVVSALRAHSATVAEGAAVTVDVSSAGREHVGLKESVARAAGGQTPFDARFELPVNGRQLYLSRTHRVVESIAAYVMDSALDPVAEGVARRCGVIRTRGVSGVRKTALLVRFRFHIVTKSGETETPLLAEDCRVLAFTGAPSRAVWLPPSEAEALLALSPDANVPADHARNALQKIFAEFDAVRPALDNAARELGRELLEAHRRVRTAARRTGVSYRVEPQFPPDVLGVYVFLPMGG